MPIMRKATIQIGNMVLPCIVEMEMEEELDTEWLTGSQWKDIWERQYTTCFVQMRELPDEDITPRIEYV